MAYSTQRVTSGGTLALLDISIDYLDRSEISVLYNGVLNTLNWSWFGTTEKRILFSPDVPNLTEVTVLRTTDLSTVRHNFSGGAAFTFGTVDEDFVQVLHIAQEARENASIADIFQNLDIHGYKLVNLGTAVNPGDAVPYGQFAAHDATILGYKTAANASAIAAAASEAAAAISAAAAAAVVEPAIHAAATKATPVDADELTLVDSAAAWVLKKFTWANLKAALKAYFDPLYIVAGRNYLINGGMAVNQRPSTASSHLNWVYGGSDRTCVLTGGTSSSGTIQLYSNGGTSTGYAQGVIATTTGAGAVYFQQRVESWNALGLNSRTVTMSALVYQNTGVAQDCYLRIAKPTSSVDVFTAQTSLGVSGANSIPSGVPTRIYYTYTLGAAEASYGLAISVEFSNVGAVTAKDFWISDFQLERGAVATPFEMRSYGAELAACQRYYQTIPSGAILSYQYSTTIGTPGMGQYCYPVTMRNYTAPPAPSFALTNSGAPTVYLQSTNAIAYVTTSTAIGAFVFYSNSVIRLNSEL